MRGLSWMNSDWLKWLLGCAFRLSFCQSVGQSFCSVCIWHAGSYIYLQGKGFVHSASNSLPHASMVLSFPSFSFLFMCLYGGRMWTCEQSFWWKKLFLSVHVKGLSLFFVPSGNLQMLSVTDVIRLFFLPPLRPSVRPLIHSPEGPKADHACIDLRVHVCIYACMYVCMRVWSIWLVPFFFHSWLANQSSASNRSLSLGCVAISRAVKTARCVLFSLPFFWWDSSFIPSVDWWQTSFDCSNRLRSRFFLLACLL